MLKLKKVAVTGGIACGKSSICQIFKKLGAYVISADEVVHHHLSNNSDLIEKVGDLLGNDVIVEGKIDRKAVADKVFLHPDLLNALERILHPEVEKEIEAQFQKVKQKNKYPLFVAEIPVFFESDLGHASYDAVVVVEAPEDLCRERFKSKTGSTDEDFDRRVAFQVPLEEKVKQADFVIKNDKDIENLHKQLRAVYESLTS
ncbi:MAG: Dephospho-CoA kinase [Chlamydiae bacterium]|nr:Dephospho-CoA kinase [Chlamydiota bacterium]